MESYRPPPPTAETLVESPQAGAWLEAQELLMDSLKSWKPLKEVSQVDLDRALGDTQDPVSDTRLVSPSTISIEKLSLVQGISAGFESDPEVQSQLDDLSLEEEAFSDSFLDEDYLVLKGPHFTEEEDEPVERYLKTAPPDLLLF